MVEINVTGDFEQWWDGLSEGEQDDVTVAVDLLEREGEASPKYRNDIKPQWGRMR